MYHSPRVLHPHLKIQLANRGRLLDSNNTSCILYTIQHTELVLRSFDSFWTTLYEYVPYRSARWRYVTLHAQARNLRGNLCIFQLVHFARLKFRKPPKFVNPSQFFFSLKLLTLWFFVRIFVIFSLKKKLVMRKSYVIVTLVVFCIPLFPLHVILCMLFYPF